MMFGLPFLDHSVQPRSVEHGAGGSVIHEMTDVMKAVAHSVTLKDRLLIDD